MYNVMVWKCDRQTDDDGPTTDVEAWLKIFTTMSAASAGPSVCVCARASD